jgi:hypothetical protein
MCPVFDDDLPSLSLCRFMPQRTKEELDAIRAAVKYNEPEEKEAIEEGVRRRFYNLNLIPLDLDKVYLRALRASGPFRRHFDEGNSQKYKNQQLKKLHQWDGELITDFFSQVTNFYAKRATSVVQPALATDGFGNLTKAAAEFLDRFLMIIHLLTFERGGRTYIKNGSHHCGNYLKSLPLTIAKLKHEIKSRGGWEAWVASGGHLEKTPYNLYCDDSWLARSRETKVWQKRTAPCISLHSCSDQVEILLSAVVCSHILYVIRSVLSPCSTGRNTTGTGWSNGTRSQTGQSSLP